MVGTGGVLVVILNVAGLLVAVPIEFVTRSRNWSPLSANVVVAISKVVDVALGMFDQVPLPASLRCH
jgi:hypothetical protein